MSKLAMSDSTESHVSIFCVPEFMVSRTQIHFNVRWTTRGSSATALSSPSPSDTLSAQCRAKQDVLSYAQAVFAAADDIVAKYASGVYAAVPYSGNFNFSILRGTEVKPNSECTNVKEEHADHGEDDAANSTLVDTEDEKTAGEINLSKVLDEDYGLRDCDDSCTSRLDEADTTEHKSACINEPSIAQGPSHASHPTEDEPDNSETLNTINPLDYIDKDLPLQTQHNLLDEINAPLSLDERSGYIYVIEIFNSHTPGTKHFKIGFETVKFNRVNHWRKHYGLENTLLRGHIYAMHLRRVERLIHLEVGAYAISKGMPTSMRGNPCIVSDTNGRPCPVMHVEIFSFPYDAMESIVKPVVQGWAEFVDEFYGERL
ncbi:hypothetical protein BD410DRAFT_902121 [Rickenella mellea]|uniref:Bacteriophage T5 Orf172 DNA-binding domain-containing protein n=1 Tax=Rickenella mellea TaxID=50990 RepID=A0A4Y7PP52_9AGAM|nr:hypothetical protein BD410DRAFT_902121 [Rickenella mellea]